MNKVFLVGNLGQDPEAKTLESGTQLAKFSLATRRGKDKTDWHNVVIWGKSAEVAAQYARKGHRVGIVGSVQYDSWEDQDGNTRYKTEIHAHEIELLTSKSEAGESSQSSRPAPAQEKKPKHNPFEQAAEQPAPAATEAAQPKDDFDIDDLF